MGAHVLGGYDVQRHHGIGGLGDVGNAVGGIGVVRVSGELVRIAAAGEAEALEQREGGLLRQDGDIAAAVAEDQVVGVVGLVHGEGHALRVRGDLADRVDDAAVVLVVVVGRQHEQAIAELEHGGVFHIAVHHLNGLRQRLRQRIGQRLQFGQLIPLQCGLDGDLRRSQHHVLAGGQRFLHQLQAGGRPGAVLDEAHHAVLQVVRNQIMQQVVHRGEDAHVERGRGEHDVADAEGLGQDLGGMGDGYVVHADVRHALVGQHAGQNVGGVLGVAVYGAVHDHHGVVLRSVAGPLAVLLQQPAQVLAPDGAVQRADGADVQRGGLVQHGLHLRAVLAHDVGIIAAGVIQPVALEVHLIGEQVAVQCAEGAEGVGGEQRAGGGIEADHDLRPVNHRRHGEGEGVRAGGQRVALLDDVGAASHIHVEELADHRAGLGGADHRGLRIAAQHVAQRGAMVGLHVVHDHVIQRTAVQHGGQVLLELIGHGVVHRVQQHGLFVQQHVGVVGDAARNGIHVLEQRQSAVVRADPVQIFGDLAVIVH